MSILKRIFSYKFHIRGLFDPFIGLKISSMGGVNGVNGVKREIPIIISLTSYEERFKDLPLTLYSLLNQDLKPDRIILWLNEDYGNLNDLPYEITQFIKNGLEIRFVKDIKSYTKVIYAFKELPESIIVTADDDIFYPSTWLKKLYLSYISNPNDIQVHRAHRVDLDQPYEKWEKGVKEENSSFTNFLTGVGGVLYPPKCFTKEVLREDIFLKYAPTADDIWLWVMALVHKRKIRIVKNHIKTLICTNIFTQLLQENLYKENKKGGNDKQLQALMKFYGENIISKISQK